MFAYGSSVFSVRMREAHRQFVVLNSGTLPPTVFGSVWRRLWLSRVGGEGMVVSLAEPCQRRTGPGAGGMLGQGRHWVLWSSQAVLGCFRRK